MKLTNTIRDAFIRSAMDDVPSIDYTEKIRSEAMKLAIAALPPKVRALYSDSATRDFVSAHYRTVVGVHMQLPGASRDSLDGIYTKLAHLEASQSEQRNKRNALTNNLRAVAYSVTTRKALAEALPEFAKYLPADEAAALRTVPALANVVADFVQAGWPKGKKPAKAAAAARA